MAGIEPGSFGLYMYPMARFRRGRNERLAASTDSARTPQTQTLGLRSALPKVIRVFQKTDAYLQSCT